MSIKINQTNIRIRPSSVDTFQQCSYQWAKVFLEGITTIPSARAAVGTAIHKAIEVMWLEAMYSKKKEPNLSAMLDAGVESFKESTKEGMRYDNGEDINSCNKEIAAGTNAFVEELVPFLDIPDAVETYLEIPISGHPIVSSVGGTVDYLTSDCLDDVKTSKKTPSPANYVTQQSIYRLLAEKNGKNIKHNRIQGVVLTKIPKAVILDLQPNVYQAKHVLNTILDTIAIAAKDIMPIDLLFRCNTKYYLCSPLYCSLHGSCPATK